VSPLGPSASRAELGSLGTSKGRIFGNLICPLLTKEGIGEVKIVFVNDWNLTPLYLPLVRGECLVPLCLPLPLRPASAGHLPLLRGGGGE